ncbi:MAG: HTH-type transcriptional repressor of NAD biosynthesis genes [Arenicella sp.]
MLLNPKARFKMTKTGLILGKFMPIHKGHQSLIEFGRQNCDRLIVLICALKTEPIAGKLRLDWVNELYSEVSEITVEYTEVELPEAPYSSRSVSKAWADYLSQQFPQVNLVFSSEKYGDYLAEYMETEHLMFDEARNQTPISATAIRENPFQNWDFIPKPVRPFYVKKICIYGAESVGKSTLTERLATHFNTAFVPEMAREVIGATEDCDFADMMRIAKSHAKEIQKQTPTANKLLFVDTDLLITKVYSEYLFGKTPNFPNWIEKANEFDLHLYLTPNTPYEQDGTRLGEHTRDELDGKFLTALEESGFPFLRIESANWESRFEEAISKVEEVFFLRYFRVK